MMASITEERMQSLCKADKGKDTCRYLMLKGTIDWECGKGTPFGDILKKRCDRGQTVHTGDNCSGPPSFTEISQDSAESAEKGDR